MHVESRHLTLKKNTLALSLERHLQVGLKMEPTSKVEDGVAKELRGRLQMETVKSRDSHETESDGETF